MCDLHFPHHLFKRVGLVRVLPLNFVTLLVYNIDYLSKLYDSLFELRNQNYARSSKAVKAHVYIVRLEICLLGIKTKNDSLRVEVLSLVLFLARH